MGTVKGELLTSLPREVLALGAGVKALAAGESRVSAVGANLTSFLSLGGQGGVALPPIGSVLAGLSTRVGDPLASGAAAATGLVLLPLVSNSL